MILDFSQNNLFVVFEITEANNVALKHFSSIEMADKDKNADNCFISDNPDTFKESIIRLFSDESLQKKFVLNARDLYNKKYAPNVQAEKRLRILKDIV